MTISSPRSRRGGDLDDDHGQAEVQVLAKLPAGNGLLKVPVGGRQDAGVARNLIPSPNTLEAFLLKRPQKLHLDRRRQLTDLIEEERAARGGLDMPFALRVGIGKRAFLMAKEFAFEQVLRDRVAVDGDERTALLRTQAMERLGHHFLAGAACGAQNQYRGAGGGHLADELEEGLHLWTCAKHVLEGVGPRAVLEGAVFLLEIRQIHATMQHDPEFVRSSMSTGL